MDLAQMFQALKQQFPNLTLTEFNNALAGTGLTNPGYNSYTDTDRYILATRLQNTPPLSVPNNISTGADAMAELDELDAAQAAGAAGGTGKLGAMFGKLKGNVGWNKANGLSIAGHNIGKVVPWAVGIGEGVQALSGLDEISRNKRDMQDVANDALVSAMSNPMAFYDLSPSEQRTLRQVKNGTFNKTSFADGFSNPANILTGGLKGVAMGAAGGIPGMIVGGIGGALNGGIQNASDSQNRKYSQLQGLYNNLQSGAQDMNSMRRQSAMRRYSNSW